MSIADYSARFIRRGETLLYLSTSWLDCRRYSTVPSSYMRTRVVAIAAVLKAGFGKHTTSSVCVKNVRWLRDPCQK